ncbi:hypothetical protein D3C85_1124630 [compost metagenome]
MGQSQQYVVGAAGARLHGALDDLLQLGLVEPRDHGGRQHSHRYPGLCQLLDDLEPTRSRAGAGLQLSPQCLVQGGDRHHHLAEPLPGQLGQQIEIAQYHGALGDDPHRMAMGQHHLQQLAGEAIVVLYGLVGIGIGPEHYGLRLVARLGKFPAQQRGGIELGKQPGLEIQAGGELQIGVAGSGIAVDAAMLAPLIGIDGAAEGDVRREVVADDALGLDLPHLGSGLGRTKCRLPFHGLPAIVDGIDLRAAETVLDIVGAASSCHLITPYTVYTYSHSARDSAKHQVRPLFPYFTRPKNGISCLICRYISFT